MGFRVYYLRFETNSESWQDRDQPSFITFANFDTALEWAAYVALDGTVILAVETHEGTLLNREQIIAALLGRRSTRARSQAQHHDSTAVEAL